MSDVDPQLLLEQTISIAKSAGELILKNYRRDLRIEYKGAINLVTEVDRASEKLIIEKITALHPQHDIMAEEGSANRKDSPYKWIIDPLDGTTNFAHGYPCFCVSIGLEFKGEMLLGVVFDPVSSELFSARCGGGAFCNGEKIHVSKTDKLNAALVGTGFAYNVRESAENNLNHFSKMVMNAQGVRRDGSAALDMCHVACGRFDGYWELGLFPWDVAAGLVIVEEAGGRVTRFNEKKFSVYDREILVTNGLIHSQISDVLLKND